MNGCEWRCCMVNAGGGTVQLCMSSAPPNLKHLLGSVYQMVLQHAWSVSYSDTKTKLSAIGLVGIWHILCYSAWHLDIRFCMKWKASNKESNSCFTSCSKVYPTWDTKYAAFSKIPAAQVPGLFLTAWKLLLVFAVWCQALGSLQSFSHLLWLHMWWHSWVSKGGQH